MLNLLDKVIVFGFFAVVLVLGFRNINKIPNLNIFAVGTRKFSTFALFSTVIATWLSGSSFFITVSNTYTKGLSYFLPSLGMVLCLLILGTCIAPRLKNFLGITSVASLMHKAYGQPVRKITAVCGFIGISGSVAIQFKVLGQLTADIFVIPLEYATFITGMIVIVYTMFGGIYSVVKTDIIQFLAFIISLPFVGIIFFNTFLYEANIDALSNPKFNILRIQEIPNFDLLNSILLFLYFAIPAISPTDFQRLTMGITTHQATKAYTYSAMFFFIMKIIMLIFPLALFCIDSDIPENNILSYILNKFTTPGIKGMLILGISAMAMSTADSMLNIGSVLISNDLLKIKSNKHIKPLRLAQVFVFVLGLLAIILANHETNLLNLIINTNCFYMPVVTVPLILFLYGFKTTEQCVLIAMTTSLFFVLLTKFILRIDNIIFPPIGMLINLITLISSHYLIEKWELLKRFGIKSKL